MTHHAENDAPLEPGEAYYTRWGWSGCAGSAWRTLPSGAKDGWRHAEEAQARADALAAKIDRCTEHLRTALGYADGDRDAGLESLAVQVKRTRVLPPADPRDPAACPRCGEVCKYDGWDHVHANGVGIGSCPTPPEVGSHAWFSDRASAGYFEDADESPIPPAADQGGTDA